MAIPALLGQAALAAGSALAPSMISKIGSWLSSKPESERFSEEDLQYIGKYGSNKKRNERAQRSRSKAREFINKALRMGLDKSVLEKFSQRSPTFKVILEEELSSFTPTEQQQSSIESRQSAKGMRSFGGNQAGVPDSSGGGISEFFLGSEPGVRRVQTDSDQVIQARAQALQNYLANQQRQMELLSGMQGSMDPRGMINGGDMQGSIDQLMGTSGMQSYGPPQLSSILGQLAGQFSPGLGQAISQYGDPLISQLGSLLGGR